VRRIKVNDREILEYYHRGVVAHLIGMDLALPLDVEIIRPSWGTPGASLPAGNPRSGTGIVKRSDIGTPRASTPRKRSRRPYGFCLRKKPGTDASESRGNG